MLSLRTLFLLAFLFLIAACQQNENSPTASSSNIEVLDFAEKSVVLRRPAQRIVALAPHIVENLFSIGAGDRIVGVMQYSNFPEQANDIEIVGSYESVNFERILDLDPDLIITWQTGNSQSSIQRLADLGYPIYIDQPDSVNDIAKSLRDFGTLTGLSDVAKSKAISFLSEIESFEAANKSKPVVSSFYQVWNSPLQTINGSHIISHAIEICGGENIYADEFAIAPVINIESVLERNPDVIIASGMSESRPEWLDEWIRWPSLHAVKNNNLFHVNPDIIQRHTLRIVQGIESICQQLDQARSRSAQE